MAVSLYHSATEYISNALTFTRGTSSDVTSVGFYATTVLNAIPLVASFTSVTLAIAPGNPLAIAGETDVVTLVGPRSGQVNYTVPGDYQVFVLVTTATEDIIRKCDVLTIL